MKGKPDTSWGKSATWYDKLLGEDDTYQRKVILPNLLRQLNLKRGEIVLDLACGQGFFSNEFYKTGAKVIGCDIAEELIEIAKKKSPKEIEYKICSSNKLDFLTNASVNKIVCILALQNIQDIIGTMKECRRVLKKDGEFFLVLNHPAFRIPQWSSWMWDEEVSVQYRRIDRYMSEDKVKIQTHPGTDPSKFTFSFHRPLQYYFKMLAKNGLAVTGMEEWISHRQTTTGPRKEAENRSRIEIPLFMFLKAIKLWKRG